MKGGSRVTNCWCRSISLNNLSALILHQSDYNRLKSIEERSSSELESQSGGQRLLQIVIEWYRKSVHEYNDPRNQFHLSSACNSTIDCQWGSYSLINGLLSWMNESYNVIIWVTEILNDTVWAKARVDKRMKEGEGKRWFQEINSNVTPGNKSWIDYESERFIVLQFNSLL